MTEEPRKTRQVSKTKKGESRLAEGPKTKEKSVAPKKLTKKQLEQSLKDAQAQVEKYKSQLAYLQADHENYVKSMERRETNLRLQANRDLILSLLPILDDMNEHSFWSPRLKSTSPSLRVTRCL